MNSHLSTRFLLIALAVLIAVACAYLLLSALSERGGAWGGGTGNLPPITVQQSDADKLKVLRSLNSQ